MSVPLPDVDLRPDHWAIVRDALRRHVPDREVLAFGSRATWTAKDYSDLDLAIMGEEPLSLRAASALNEALVESDLPFRVDIVDWARVDDGFRAIIRGHGVPVQTPAAPSDTTRAAPASSPTLGSSAARSEWRESKWGDEITLEYGRARRGHDNSTGPFRVFGSNGPIGWTDTPLVPGPGVVLGRKGAYRGVVYSPDPFFVIDTAYYVASKSTHDMRWLFYAIKHYQLGEIDDGSPIPSTTRAAVYPCNLTVPPLPEQRAISHVLGSLDDKIELNRRMNETLEAMARALFKSWFVDFDPVRAKMEGRDTGLPQDIADQFPDRLVDSEMGEVPEGWEVFRLDELTHHHTRSTSPFHSPELEYEHFSIPAYDAGQHPAVEPGVAIRSNKTVVPDDAVLLSKLNPRFARVWVPPDSMGRPQVCSTEFLAFTPKAPANRSLLFALFADQHFRALLKSLVTGTSKSHQRVPPPALKAHEVLAGSRRLFAVFGEATGGMLARILKNRSEAAILASLRDTLLPKLISGEMRLGKTARNFGRTDR